MPSTVGIAAIRISPDSLSFRPWISCFMARASPTMRRAPVQRALAFGRKALKPRAALHQHDTEHFLELLEAGRHRRLGDAAGLRRTSEMTFLCQGEQQFKLVDHAEDLGI